MYLKDIKGQALTTDYSNVPQTTQVHYHVEQTQVWTKASVIIAGVSVLLGLISLFGKRK
jgi:hypothetical protein